MRIAFDTRRCGISPAATDWYTVDVLTRSIAASSRTETHRTDAASIASGCTKDVTVTPEARGSSPLPPASKEAGNRWGPGLSFFGMAAFVDAAHRYFVSTTWVAWLVDACSVHL
jgi:hypothetical protein